MLQPALAYATSRDQVQVSWLSATTSKLEALLAIVEEKYNLQLMLRQMPECCHYRHPDKYLSPRTARARGQTDILKVHI